MRRGGHPGYLRFEVEVARGQSSANRGGPRGATRGGISGAGAPVVGRGQRRSSSSAGRKAEEGSAGWLERGKGEGDDRWGPPVGVTERVKG